MATDVKEVVVSSSPSRPTRARLASLGVAAAIAAVASTAAAQTKAKPALPPPPVSIRIIAPTPDPPWTVRIDNEGDRPVRIPADVRLLSFDIQKPGKHEAWRPCRPAPGQKPTSFPQNRVVYLAPGESWVESFDPRLFCFGKEGDLLRGATLVRTRFGFGRQGWSPTREPFAAQSTDDPVSFASTRELAAPTILLGYPRAEIAPIQPAPLHATRANEPLDKAPPPPPAPPPVARVDRADETKDPDAKKQGGEVVSGPASPAPAKTAAADAEPGYGHDHGPHDEPTRGRKGEARLNAHDEADLLEKKRAKERELERERELRETYVDSTIGVGGRDMQAPDLDLYVDGWSDGGAPRDVVLHIHARNEGGRALASVIRSRMLRFRVEGPMTPHNQTQGTVECLIDDRIHGVPVEMVRSLRSGERTDVPFLIAEICPRGTFDRPGLYRVTPLLVSQIEGEAVVHRDAFQGRVRALQPALARIGSSRLPFYDGPPRSMRTIMIGRDPDDPPPDDAVHADGAATDAARDGAPPK